MLNRDFSQQIKCNLSYHPTADQENAIALLSDYVLSSGRQRVFLLEGYAGTGKTSLVGALVKTLDEWNMKCVLLAPTGRAAKVFAHYAEHSAYTIHRMIYRQRVFSHDMDNFTLNINLHKHTLFIVDEASMVANEGLSGGLFGGGRLLDDLISYVYNDSNCRLIMVGDTAQLPPIGEKESPALSVPKLEEYGLSVCKSLLTQVVRQGNRSGILYNATCLREWIRSGSHCLLPKIQLYGFQDIKAITGDELIEQIQASYDTVGMEETAIICRSNKRANLYNNGIRNMILYREDELNAGDLLMVAKNNYYWTSGNGRFDFIANGDMAVVRRVRKIDEDMYGFRFADVLLVFPDYDNLEIEVKILLDTLHSDAPSLQKEQSDNLFYAVLEDYADIPNKREQMKKVKENKWYNALQVKYAYAFTCHKAQGGQWKHVFIDQGYLSGMENLSDYCKWLYTAFTRATEKLYLVNWSSDQYSKEKE